MSSLVFFAVLASAFFQASWNFYAKKSTAHKSSLLLVGWLFFGALAVPISALFTDFSTFTINSLYFICLSGFIHCFYVLMLSWAYTVGEISVVYPVARGCGIAFTTIFAYLLKFDNISNFGIVGISCIILGTFVIGLAEVLRSSKDAKAFFIAVGVGIIISSYSLADSRGVQYVPEFFFVAIINLATTIFALPIMLTKFRKPIKVVLKKHKLEAFTIASFGAFAYLIVLWAFTKEPTSYVVALREFSIVIATLLGVFILKEKIYKTKVLALILIVSGIIIIKIS